MGLFPPTFFAAVGLLWEFAITWWWLFLPFLLFGPAKRLWIFSREMKYDAEKAVTMLLEVRVPATERIRPFKSMEAVWAGIWQVYDPPNPREHWLEGQFTPSVTVEIVSLGGEIHFYLRFARKDRRTIESAVYSQFPDAELTEAEDYIKKFPSTMPNKEWDFYGTDFKMMKDKTGSDVAAQLYPIRTYASFFEPSPESKEEMRIDPMGTLLEGLSLCGPGENIFLQIRTMPIGNDDDETHLDFKGAAKGMVDKLAGRKVPEKGKALAPERKVLKAVLTGKAEEEVKEEPQFDFPEMRLTPGEREVVQAIETKVAKHMFHCHIRAMYVAKREVYWAPSKALLYNYWNQFGTHNLNAIILHSDTKTKVKTFKAWFLDRRRVFVRKRHIWRRYVMRVPYNWPKSGTPFLLLNAEELASLFHFPSKSVGPGATLERIESKKGEAPPEIPIE